MEYTLGYLTKRMHQFVESKGFYGSNGPHPQTPSNIAKSLIIEAAEVLEIFQWSDKYDSQRLAGELADVALYLMQLAALTEIDLGRAILEKLEVNADREWSTEDGITHLGE